MKASALYFEQAKATHQIHLDDPLGAGGSDEHVDVALHLSVTQVSNSPPGSLPHPGR